MKRLLLVLCSLGLLTAAYERINTPVLMSDAARAYLNSLTAKQRAQSTMPFDSEERLNFRFVPEEDRKGVALREMTPPQKHLGRSAAFRRALEPGHHQGAYHHEHGADLKEQEANGKGGLERDPEKYYVSIFGEPSERAPGVSALRATTWRPTSRW